MALLSQQVTIPAFLFAKIIYCPNRDTEAVQPIDNENGVICPTVASRISDLWMLVVWPFYVVAVGLLVGYFAAKVSGCPARQVTSCLAACAFGNSTGLPITLLSVIHKQFRSSTELGRIDPTAFLVFIFCFTPFCNGVPADGCWRLWRKLKGKSRGMSSRRESTIEGTRRRCIHLTT